MKKVTIGQRNQFITIESNEPIKNALGEPEPNWVKVSDAWAKVSNKTDGESESSGRINVKAVYWLITDFIPDINESMRIIWNGKTLNISNAHDPDGTNEVLKITAFLDG